MMRKICANFHGVIISSIEVNQGGGGESASPNHRYLKKVQPLRVNGVFLKQLFQEHNHSEKDSVFSKVDHGHRCMIIHNLTV